MTSKVWLITGASRGMGQQFVKQALSQGDRVVATARRVTALDAVFEDEPRLAKVALDLTDIESIKTAVEQAVNQFGRIDVLLNNAGSFLAGYFEQLTPEQLTSQFAVNVFGTMNVTREVLPIMRAQRQGRILTITSSAGVVGMEFNDGYAASKFAVEGWLESMAPVVARFGIQVTMVEPGMFRSELLSQASTKFGSREIDDYQEKSDEFKQMFMQTNGRQPGDPQKLAEAVGKLATLQQAPLHFVAGHAGLISVEEKLANFQADIDQYRELSESLDFSDK